MKNNKDKAGLISWLNADMLKPVVLGDENFALRIRSYIGSQDCFSHFDAESLMSSKYEPNTIIVIGPINGLVRKKIDAYQGPLKESTVVYVESIMRESERPTAMATAEELSASASVIKEFVEVKDVISVLKELASV